MKHSLLCLAAAVLLTGTAAAYDTVVVFNELHYNPVTAGEDGEWLELHNQNGVNVDLSGWKLSGGVEFAFPDGTVIPGKGHLVVARNPAASGIAGALGPWTGALSNSGEIIRLRDNNGRIMDEIEYQDKGEWPVAPDGSGVTLSKRAGDLNTGDPSSWTASPQAGGTPGAANFAPPPAPTTTRVIAQTGTWKFLNTGNDPGAAWKEADFDDAAWQSGDGGFGFGSPQIFETAPVVLPGGLWNAAVWTGDADSGMSSSKIYTHKIGLNRAGNYTAINGVTFESPGSEVRTGPTWSLTGAGASYVGNGPTSGANLLPSGTGSRELCEDFFYGADGGRSTVTLSGLTPGQAYIATFYGVGFGGAGIRLCQIIPADGGAPFLVDANAAGNGQGLTVRYRYVAPQDGEMKFDFVPVVAANTWHHYAFTNETTAMSVSEQVIASPTVAAFSSQLTTGFTRGAQNTVNNSGLSAGQHGVTPNGTMWLSNGTFSTPSDPLPADITWDMGSAVDLTSVHVWNYNENSPPNLSTRGSRQVEILTAAAAGGPFISRGTFTLYQASGLNTEPGQRIEMIVPGVRQVKFNILNNHGGDNQFVGLSEVKFYRTGVPGPGIPTAYREPVSTLFSTGMSGPNQPIASGQPDPHYINTANGQPLLAMTPNGAWLADDGLSRFIGPTGSGADSIPAGDFTYQTTFDLSGYRLPSLQVRLYAAADNSLNSATLNGTALSGVTAASFANYYGPYTITGPFNTGSNTFRFVWNNAGTDANPGGVRLRWDATAEPNPAKTVLAANPTTTWFRKKFTVSGSAGSRYTGALRYVVDDGAVFWLNGTEIARSNITGNPGPGTPADSDVLYPQFSSITGIPGGILHAGENILTVELHQATAGAADALFACTLDVTETPAPPSATALVQVDKVTGAASGAFTVDLKNISGGTLDLTGYILRSSGGGEHVIAAAPVAAGGYLTLTSTQTGFTPLDGDKLFVLSPGGTVVMDALVMKNRAQARDGSGQWLTPESFAPGSASAFNIPSSIVINEIMYHQHPVWLPTGIIESEEEWIELHNKSGEPVSLTGWKLRGGVSYDFAGDVSIPAGGFLVVAKDSAALKLKYPAIGIVGDFSGSLSNSGEKIVLEDSNDNPADEVNYRDGGRWDGRADGGGSSLELRDPRADNSLPEAWAASDESGKSAWQTFTYSGTGAPPPGSNDPAQYNEFILGLINSGEFLIDDISVKEVNVSNRELIQNGNFTTGTANFWRLLGNHGSHGNSVVVDDPSSPGNKVLKVVATGAAEHMHNHVETTFKNSGSFVAINAASTYNITFRARWVSGCPRLNTRLYFNRLARQHLLAVPEKTGTPGAMNSRRVANIGPVLSSLSHLPVVPAANASVTVRVRAADPDGVGTVTMRWRRDGEAGWQTVGMTGAAGEYSAVIPAQTAGTLVEFAVDAADLAGTPATATFPAWPGLVKWSDGTVPPGPGHGMRLLMTKANADFMHLNTNVMSNDSLPCTVIYRESEVFYDTRMRLKSSQRGRLADIRLGFAVEFDPTHLFRGKMTAINLDRSGYWSGTTGTGFGHTEIMHWHVFNRAGGIPSMYNDLVYIIAPRPAHTGSAMLTMAEFNDGYLDGQYDNGASTPTFKFELIYFPLTTVGGNPEGLKIANPDDVRGVNIQSHTSASKEAYRWNFIIGNAREADDYTRVQNLASAFRTGGSYLANLPQAIDVDEWLRCFAGFALAGVGDHYTSSANAWHNLKLYHRPDGKILFLPWDPDFTPIASNSAVRIQQDLINMTNASPAYYRAFYGHIHDIATRAYRTDYLTNWVNHYATFSTAGGNWGDILTYVAARRAFVLADCNTQFPTVPFRITTNSGNDFQTDQTQVTLDGDAWVNVRTLRLQGSAEPLNVTWTDRDSWRITLPVAPQENNFVIEAVGYDGTVVTSDSIKITGTGTLVPASAENLVVSEILYNPAEPSAAEFAAGYTDNDDFEFIELKNISAATLNLTGVSFTAGITWSAPAGTLIPPGGRVVIPRRTAAFALRFPGVTTLPHYYQAAGNMLDNAGEQIALSGAGGADIKRFSYDDSAPWPAAADGAGASLVLVAPSQNPDHGSPLSWRPSVGAPTPGTGDALPLPANPSGDDNGNGRNNLLDYVLGPDGALPSVTFGTDGAERFLSMVLERRSGVDAMPLVQISSDLGAWTGVAVPEISGRQFMPSGIERITLRVPLPAGAGQQWFARVKWTAGQ